jgi:hypothetical protein
MAMDMPTIVMKAGKTTSAAVKPAHFACRRTGNTFGITVSNAAVAFTMIIPNTISPRSRSSDGSRLPVLSAALTAAGAVVFVRTPE